jgi:putative nucleotidyltransferase with HDIG domain
LAQDLLQPELPDRYAHVVGVAQRAAEVCTALNLGADLIVSAAWLHDIGYASAVDLTGFHPLDGARFVAEAGYPATVASLVAFHATAEVEAEERGCLHELVGEFARPEAKALAVLTYCDMTVGPRGDRLTISERLQDILARYEPADVVHRSTRRAETELRATVDRVERWLAQSQ